jgi:hypothetical protein
LLSPDLGRGLTRRATVWVVPRYVGLGIVGCGDEVFLGRSASDTIDNRVVGGVLFGSIVDLVWWFLPASCGAVRSSLYHECLHRCTPASRPPNVRHQPCDNSSMADNKTRDDKRSQQQGISNRETPADEAREREEFPPVEGGSPPPEDAAGRVGEAELNDTRDRHTSHKAGMRSIAQKEDESRYPDRSMPASRKVDGAFGREPGPGEDQS